jgi:riboflavin biosynthesis pyrimidine reductase
MRLLLNEVDPSITPATEVEGAQLTALYAYPERDATAGRPVGRKWLRANMVTTLDGAASGADGRTGSINTEADRQVFQLLRALADVIVVGAGTARVEGYRAPQPPRDWLATVREGRPAAPSLAVVTRTGNLPLQLTVPPDDAGDSGEVFLVTCGAADERAVDAAREVLGEQRVLVLGDTEVDLAAMVEGLAGRGLTRMLTEGGPTLLHDLAAAGLVDEICLTVVPHLIGGDHPRILDGEGVDVPLMPRLLLESEGTLLGRWSTALPSN